MKKLISVLALILFGAAWIHPQVKTVSQYLSEVQALASRADVKAANDYIDRNHEGILREWIAITEINAPSGQEQSHNPRWQDLRTRHRRRHPEHRSAPGYNSRTERSKDKNQGRPGFRLHG